MKKLVLALVLLSCFNLYLKSKVVAQVQGNTTSTSFESSKEDAANCQKFCDGMIQKGAEITEVEGNETKTKKVKEVKGEISFDAKGDESGKVQVAPMCKCNISFNK